MKKPYRTRHIELTPKFTHFKPLGVPLRLLQRIKLTLDEYEAIRLADYEQMEHREAARAMHISRPTFTRLIKKARHKSAHAMVDGHELVVVGGNIKLDHGLHRCKNCGKSAQDLIQKTKYRCPECGSDNMQDLSAPFL